MSTFTSPGWPTLTHRAVDPGPAPSLSGGEVEAVLFCTCGYVPRTVDSAQGDEASQRFHGLVHADWFGSASHVLGWSKIPHTWEDRFSYTL